jgi:multisubunit Na+/H+ antiporter MnhE subunit
MPSLPWFIKPAICATVVILFGFALIWACLKGDQTDQNLLIGALISNVSAIIGYYFGNLHPGTTPDQPQAQPPAQQQGQQA